jgi:hypothetical protein
MKSGSWTFFIFNGTVYIPSCAKTQASYLQVDPVYFVSMPDYERLSYTLKEVIRRDIADVNVPDRNSYPEPVIKKYLDSASWSKFQRSAQAWNIHCRNDCFTVHQLRWEKRGGWAGDPTATETFIAGVSIDTVVARTIELVAKAQKVTEKGA